jgi:hypothetical protein
LCFVRHAHRPRSLAISVDSNIPYCIRLLVRRIWGGANAQNPL